MFVIGVIPSRPFGLSSFGGFFTLGIEHIFTGYDHLAFLLGALIVFKRWKPLLIFISCFTVGHSLTLALATYGLLDLPSRVTEPLIAATILFIGVDNLRLRGREPGARWLVAIVFGLAHGLGFAHVLRDLGVGVSGTAIAWPLLGFNLGVEVGQVAVAGVAAPIFIALRRRREFVRFWVPALSLCVAAVGFYWLVERIFSP
jgi:hydrogenase/urease accessory protein HupE